MCSNWLAVLPHADNFGDVLDHGHKNRTLEPCGNIITVYQASNKKQRGATPFFQSTMTFTYLKSKGTDETTHILKTTAHMQFAHMGPCKHAHTNPPLQLMINFLSWLFYFIREMPRKSSAVCWLVEVTFENTLGIFLTRKADGSAKKSQGMNSEADVSISTTLHC